MAVVKLKYLKDRAHLKRHLRYITHRRGREGGSLTRKLFGSEGLTDKQAVYALIDAARRGTVFYKFMINPDPAKEDTYKDLDLEHLTRQTIQALERKLGLSLPFVAVLHPADHTNLRHVHGIFLLPRRISQAAFKKLRQVAWTTATAQARLQRRGRDRVLENPRSRRFSLLLTHTLHRPQTIQAKQKVSVRKQFPITHRRGRGVRMFRVIGGCPSCGFGRGVGLSVFLTVCPACGRGLMQERQPRLFREVAL
jgi:hypothetical protein